MAPPERSSTCMVKPPALPIPRTGGGCRTTAWPPSTLLNCRVSRLAIAVAVKSVLPARSPNGVRRRKSRPAADELERVRMENPETAIASSTPLVCLAKVDSCVITSSVRSIDDASGV